MKRFLHLIGVVLSAIGVGGALMVVMALFDPQGAQLSNDSDPFAASPSVNELLLHLIFWTAFLGAGLGFLAFSKSK